MSHDGGDGKFTYNDGIAVAQIIAFSAPLLAAIYFRYIHQIGWFCIGVFTILRLISASCKLVLINKSSHGLWGAVFVCESLGSILIIFLLLELLERINKIVPVVGKRMFLIPSLFTWIDIAISIAGWVVVIHADNPWAPTPYSQASTGLLAAIYVYLVVVFVLFWLRRSEYLEEEKWALNAVTFCIPLLALRIVYSLVFVITGNMKFNAIKGNPTAYLIMTFIPEVGIIIACTSIIAMKITPVQKEKYQPQRLEDEEV